jgi:hypothetical protein
LRIGQREKDCPMKPNLEMSEKFSQALDEEVNALSEQHGEEFAQVALAAFMNTNIFHCLELLCQSESQEDLSTRANYAIPHIAKIMTAILTMMSRNLAEEEIEMVMRFADRMYEVQLATAESIGAPKQ